MATVTVRDLLRLLPADRLRAMAGLAGLGREVRWATSLRATPPYLSHLTGAEVVVLAGAALQNAGSAVAVPALIRAVGERDGAAVVIDRLSTEALEAAEAAAIPLLLVAGANAAELESDLNRLMNERMNHLYSVSSSAGRRFAELAAAGGLAALLEHAAGVIGKTVLWEDTAFTTLMAVPPPGEALPLPGPQPPVDFRPLNTEGSGLTDLPVAADGYSRLVAPVVTSGIARGYLSAVARAEAFTDVDRAIVQRAAEAMAFELLRSQAHTREESPAVETLITELLTGRFGSASAVAGRASYLGVALDRPMVVVALDAVGEHDKDPRTREEVARVVGLEMRGRFVDALVVRGLEPAAVLVAPVDEANYVDRDRLRRQVSELVRRVSPRLAGEATLAVGLSDCHTGAEGYGQAYREALYALRVGVGAELPPPVDFVAMDFYRLLFPMSAHQEVARFRDTVLGALLEYDGRRRSEMIETLEAYFAAGCNVVDAADRLHVHRNSLAYRLRRVAEITQRDLRSQEHLFQLQLALKIHRVLEAVG